MNSGNELIDRVLERSFIVVAWWLLLCLAAAAGAIAFALWKWALR